MKAWTDSPKTKCFEIMFRNCCYLCDFMPRSSSPSSSLSSSSPSSTRFVIKDEAGTEILKIEGPLCPCSCCGDVDFNVRIYSSVIDSYVIICRKVWSYRSSFQWSSHWYPIIQMDIFWPIVYFLPIKSLFTILKVVTMDGNEVGKITKQWSGIARWNILNSKEFLFIS